MTTSKKRGRPPGSSAKNAADETSMQKMAVEMVAAPEIAPTAAMKRLGIIDETEHRRLTRKWKMQGPRFLQAEKDRRDSSHPSRVVHRSIDAMRSTGFDATTSGILAREMQRISDRDAEMRHIATMARMYEPFAPSATQQLMDQIYSPLAVAADRAMNDHLRLNRITASLADELTEKMRRDEKLLGLDPLSRLMRGF